MKNRFNTYDLICSVTELQGLIGMRVNQVYDVDTKTYLIRLQLGEKKALLLLESGIRIHVTSFEWPKNMAPSGFSMKMRKHIRNKRLEKLNQLGMDRIVDMQFGSGEAAYHVILELYDKGNIIFTDHSYTILNLLRPHTEGDAVKFVVREKYPLDRGKERPGAPSDELFTEILHNAKPDETLKKALNPRLVYGPAIIEHCLLTVGLPPSTKVKDLKLDEAIVKLREAFVIAERIIDEAVSKKPMGYIIQKKAVRPKENEDLITNEEFHPMIFEQHKTRPFLEFDSFDKAVDEFFSNMESQKIDMKGVQQEIAALKKLENVKKDHEKRLVNLEKSQIEDTKKAELITRNQRLVDDAIMAIRQAIASQMAWTDISNLVKEATNCGDSVASVIKHLKLNINHITLLLSDPYEEYDETGQALFAPALVDVDLDLSAYANAEKYYDRKRQAATKTKKTLESQDMAFKSAEKKTKQALKEVKTSVSISKARKVFWFEKFYWFISSENYLVIGGRDQQQNELIVKRYLKTNDIYVHAGIIGASSVVIKNPQNEPIPPKTLNEAGTMAMCYSTAWEAKVVTSAWWVHANQVSKTAPTGEYLTTGSFMIRGKKNFLPQCHLIMGFTFLFKLEDGSISRHMNERKRKEFDDLSETSSNTQGNEDDVELVVSDSDNEENDEKDQKNLSVIEEEQESSFPDTEVVVEHKIDESRCSVKVKLSNPKMNIPESNTSNINHEDEEYVVFLGDDTPVVIKPPDKKPEKKTASFKSSSENKDEFVKEEPKQPLKQKRGQKSRLKKIKEKYKDQDEEEREMRMRILQGCPGTKKEDKKNKKNKKGNISTNTKKESQVKKPPLAVQLLSVEEDEKADVAENVSTNPDVEDDDDKEENSELAVTVDVDMLNSLTGQPVSEDELLFAIPMVAPYNSIVNYKYKVKLTPGTGKRGKSAKTALNVFLKDKSSTPREKDLLKFVKDQDLARNFPGKVKISAPQLNKYKS